MILRSQLRMNKNIVFPFISCIMIMLTLLVLIHKSADELSAAKKEISLCKQQHDSLYTQLQSAIEYKLRLEKSLENEKSDNKRKIEEIQSLLAQEKEDRRKEKEEEDNRFDALNQKFVLKENENKDFNDNIEKLNKQLVDKDEEISKLNAKLTALRYEKDQLLADRNKVIEDLQEKLKFSENGNSAKKITPETKENVPVASPGELVQANLSNSMTPGIYQLAADNGPLLKQVAPPPPPLQQPKNEQEKENSLQKQMRKDLDMRAAEQKPEENVMKAPESKEKEKQDNLEMMNAEKDDEMENRNGGANMFGPMPNMGQKNGQASSASNRIVEQPRQEEQQQVLAMPNQNERNKEIPRQMRDYAAGDYAKDIIGEEGEEGEYMDNDVRVPVQKKDSLMKDKRQEEVDAGESVVLSPK